VSRETILRHVWKSQPFITPRTVDVHIAWLRQKLEDKPDSPRHIVTVRGEGYCFRAGHATLNGGFSDKGVMTSAKRSMPASRKN
jgi:DNA-binding winged helix-turn-helix (wHTH) protein